MKYKVVYQFRWLLVLFLIGYVYLCNLILIKLPFLSIGFARKDLSCGLLAFLLSFFPRFHFEFYIYNLQTILAWSLGILFGERIALVTLCIYILLGLCGLPVFAGGGGFDYFKEPTFGYLISLPLLGFLSGYLYKNEKKFLAIFLPMFCTHLLGITYLLFFNQEHLDITWHLSFSMIGYDLIFALILSPVLPIISFILNEMFIQEIPVRMTLPQDSDLKTKGRRITGPNL